MSYTDDKMQSLIYRIRDLNDYMKYIPELTEQLKLANELKVLELSIQTGSLTSSEARKELEKYQIKDDKTKSFGSRFFK